MSITTTIEEAAVREAGAVPAYPYLWFGNLYRLVSLWDMLTFDAGELSRAMDFLLDSGSRMCGPQRFLDLRSDHRDFFVRNVRKVSEYCISMRFGATAATLKRILGLVDNADLTLEMFGDLLRDAEQRLRDEAGEPFLLHVLAERVMFYREPRAGWEEVIVRFPGTGTDIEEANICFALERYPACVFHCVQIVETGLISLGEFLGVKDPKSGWTATANELEKISRKKYGDLTAFEAKHIGFLKQVQATVVALQDAWRNKISHAQGRLAVMTADFSPRVAEEILMASRGFMRRLATDLPPVGT
jgi:hypothetical protein